MTRYLRPARISGVTLKGSTSALAVFKISCEPVVTPPASCAITIPACKRLSVGYEQRKSPSLTHTSHGLDSQSVSNDHLAQPAKIHSPTSNLPNTHISIKTRSKTSERQIKIKSHQYMSSAPCATIEKLSAALPIERSDCAIFPPGTEASPASFRNEPTLSLIVGAPRSLPHSMAVKRSVRSIEG